MIGQGSKRLRHRIVTITVAEGIKQLLPVNQKRARILMYNSAVAGSTVYVGHNTDESGNALAAANGWPLNEDRVITWDGDTHQQKFLANVLELFTQDAVYGLAVTATGAVRIIEELM